MKKIILKKFEDNMKKNINELSSRNLGNGYTVEYEYEFVADESEILELNSHIWLFKGDTLLGYFKIPLDPNNTYIIYSDGDFTINKDKMTDNIIKLLFEYFKKI